MINYTKAILALRIISLILSIPILVSLYGTYQAIKKTDEQMKMMSCDAYGYNQENSPEFCQ